MVCFYYTVNKYKSIFCNSVYNRNAKTTVMNEETHIVGANMLKRIWLDELVIVGLLLTGNMLGCVDNSLFSLLYVIGYLFVVLLASEIYIRLFCRVYQPYYFMGRA